MIDRATWSQFYYWSGTEIWLIYCSSANHCFTIIIYVASYLVSHGGSEDYGNIDPYKAFSGTCILKEYWPRFFLAAICLLGQWRRNRWRYMYLEEKTAKHRQQNTTVSVSQASVGVPIMRTRERHLVFGILTRQDFLPDCYNKGNRRRLHAGNFRTAPPTEICCLYSQVMLSMHKTKLHVFSAGWLFATFVACWGHFVAL